MEVTYQYMKFLDKKLTGSAPEISVDPGVAHFLFFVLLSFVTFFLTENREATCFTGD